MRERVKPEMVVVGELRGKDRSVGRGIFFPFLGSEH